MQRRKFIKKTGWASAGIIAAPYILPTGRLFASTGTRLSDHVVFLLFGGGLRNQESVKQQYLNFDSSENQDYAGGSGNIMPNLFSGSEPGAPIYNKFTPILSTPLAAQGTLFPEVRYVSGPTGHYNGHTVAMTGNYTNTGLNLNINPDMPTIFEYYRKHTDPAKSAINAWWISEGLGPYPSLNYSKHSSYGAQYGANYLCPTTTFSQQGYDHFFNFETFHPNVGKITDFLNNNFGKAAADLAGIQNTEEDRESIKTFLKDMLDKSINSQQDIAFPPTGGYLSGDISTIGYACEVLKKFKPELTVINMFDIDVCHNDFSGYISNIHMADFAVGHLWDVIQGISGMEDTIMIVMPEHGRNIGSNTVYDDNGIRAYDHTSGDNAREVFTIVAGPSSVVNQGTEVGDASNPVGECIDIVPTIATILGVYDDIPAGLLPGRHLSEAFI